MLATLTMVLLLADLVMAVVGVWSQEHEIHPIDRVEHGGRVTVEEATSNDDRQRAVAAGELGMLGLTAIAWLTRLALCAGVAQRRPRRSPRRNWNPSTLAGRSSHPLNEG